MNKANPPILRHMFLKPITPDLIVANPDNKGLPLKVDGENVEKSKYWRRRIADGDVIETNPPKVKKSKGE